MVPASDCFTLCMEEGEFLRFAFQMNLGQQVGLCYQQDERPLGETNRDKCLSARECSDEGNIKVRCSTG